MATLQSLRERTYKILNDTQGSQVYTPDIVNAQIRYEIRELCGRKKWQFMMVNKLFTSAGILYLEDELETTDTTLDMFSTQYLPDAGNLLIEKDVISYTSKTSQQLAGISGAQITHSEGALLEIMYPLTDLQRMADCTYKISGSDTFRSMRYEPIFTFDTRLQAPGWSTFDHEGVTYIVPRFIPRGAIINVYYQKSPSELVNDTDETEIPDMYAMEIISTITAAKLMLKFGDDLDGEGQRMLQVANQDVARMFKVYGVREEGSNKLFFSTYKARPRLHNRRY